MVPASRTPRPLCQGGLYLFGASLSRCGTSHRMAGKNALRRSSRWRTAMEARTPPGITDFLRWPMSKRLKKYERELALRLKGRGLQAAFGQAGALDDCPRLWKLPGGLDFQKLRQCADMLKTLRPEDIPLYEMGFSLRNYLELKWRNRVDPVVTFPEITDLQTRRAGARLAISIRATGDDSGVPGSARAQRGFPAMGGTWTPSTARPSGWLPRSLCSARTGRLICTACAAIGWIRCFTCHVPNARGDHRRWRRPDGPG